MRNPDRPSLIPTFIILAGITLVVGPIVFVLAYYATHRIGLGMGITLGACFGVPLIAASAIILGASRSNRHIQRYAMSQCTRCGYDLRGTDGAICPECGSFQNMHL